MCDHVSLVTSIHAMAFNEYRPGQRACEILYLRTGSMLCNKYFIYSYSLLKKGMCEYLTNVTQIIGEIWTILLICITLKIAT